SAQMWTMSLKSVSPVLTNFMFRKTRISMTAMRENQNDTSGLKISGKNRRSCSKCPSRQKKRRQIDNATNPQKVAIRPSDLCDCLAASHRVLHLLGKFTH